MTRVSLRLTRLECTKKRARIPAFRGPLGEWDMHATYSLVGGALAVVGY